MDEMFVSKCTMSSHVSARHLYIYIFKADKKFVTFEWQKFIYNENIETKEPIIIFFTLLAFKWLNG
jgi:hypothetical protein